MLLSEGPGGSSLPQGVYIRDLDEVLSPRGSTSGTWLSTLKHKVEEKAEVKIKHRTTIEGLTRMENLT